MLWFSLLMSLLLPLIMAIGLTLMWRGMRGRVFLGQPRCRRCDYDLRWIDPEKQRVCPECGSDLHTVGAVDFGRYGRSLPMLILGAVLFLAPGAFFILPTLMHAYRVSRPAPAATIAAVTNAELITQLASDPGNPRTWQELERRSFDSLLTQPEVDEIISHLIKGLENATVGRTPISSTTFLAMVMTDDALSVQRRDELLQAYYKLDRGLEVRPKLRAGQANRFTIRGTSWDLQGFTTILALEEITLDGVGTVRASPTSSRGDLSGSGRIGLHGELTIDAEPGEHTLTFEVIVGVVAGDVGVVARPGPVENWPPTVVQWKSSIQTRVTVLPEDQSPVQLLTDNPEQAQIVRNGIRVHELIVGADGRASLMLIHSQQSSVPMCFDVLVRHDRGEAYFGRFSVFGGSTSRSGIQGIHLPDLPDDAQFVDVILRPNPEHVERHTHEQAVWGEEVLYEQIPVRWGR